MTGPPSRPLPSRRTVGVLSLVGVLVVVALGAGPATAAPPPQELCGVCGDGLERTAEEAGVPLTVEHSTATVTVGDDGAGHWRARVRLSPAASERLAASATLRERVVRETLDWRTVVDDPRNLETAVENDTLVVDFDVSGVARDRLGVSLVTFASREGAEGSVTVVADRLTVRGPDGTVPTHVPADATGTESAVVWADGGQAAIGPAVAFADSGGPAGNLATSVALVFDAGSRVGPGTLLVGGVPAFVFVAVLGLLVAVDERLPAVRPTRAAGVTVGLALGATGLAALGVAFGSLDGALLAPLAVAAGLYAAAGAAPLVLDDPSTRGICAWVASAVCLGALLGGAVSAQTLRAVLVTAPAVCFLPLGYTRPESRLRGALTAVLVVIPLLVATQAGPGGTWFDATVLTVMVALPWAVLTVALGTVLYLAGRTRASESGERPVEAVPFGTDPGAEGD
jgi:hypothetical protein